MRFSQNGKFVPVCGASRHVMEVRGYSQFSAKSARKPFGAQAGQKKVKDTAALS